MVREGDFGIAGRVEATQELQKKLEVEEAFVRRAENIVSRLNELGKNGESHYIRCESIGTLITFTQKEITHLHKLKLERSRTYLTEYARCLEIYESLVKILEEGE